METLKLFSKVTDLIENMDKSNIFIAGVDVGTKDSLLHITGFIEGHFPIR